MAIFSCSCFDILILIHKDDVACIAAVDVVAADAGDVVQPYTDYNPGFPFFYHLINRLNGNIFQTFPKLFGFYYLSVVWKQSIF